MTKQEREDFEGAKWLSNRGNYAQAYPVLQNLFNKYPDNPEIREVFNKIYSVYKPTNTPAPPNNSGLAPSNKVIKIGNASFGPAWIVLFIVILIIGGVTYYVATNPSNPATENTLNNASTTPNISFHNFGEAGKVGTWQVAVTRAVLFGPELVWSTVGNKSTATGQWLLVNIKITNNGRATDKLSLANFGIRDVDGNVYTADFTSNTYSDFQGFSEISKNIPPGVTTATILVFDVKWGIKTPTLLFALDSKNGVVYGLGDV